MIPMKSIHLSLMLFALLCSANAQKHSITAGAIVEKIKGQLTVDWQEKTVDTFKSGSEESQVHGIATTFLANLDVLKRAKEKGLNMIITHEPTFYNHLDDKKPYGDDPVLKAKLKFIEENDVIIWRFHDHWHRTSPDGIYKGIIDKLDWSMYQKEQNLYVIPEITLGDLVKRLKSVFDAKAIRVIGEPQMILKNVGIILGAPGSLSQIELLRRDDVDVLIGGETREWETVEYVRDAISTGMDKALILLGHAISEEEGMKYCADWLENFIADIPVEFVPANEPFWIPN